MLAGVSNVGTGIPTAFNILPVTLPNKPEIAVLTPGKHDAIVVTTPASARRGIKKNDEKTMPITSTKEIIVFDLKKAM